MFATSAAIFQESIFFLALFAPQPLAPEREEESRANSQPSGIKLITNLKVAERELGTRKNRVCTPLWGWVAKRHLYIHLMAFCASAPLYIYSSRRPSHSYFNREDVFLYDRLIKLLKKSHTLARKGELILNNGKIVNNW